MRFLAGSRGCAAVLVMLAACAAVRGGGESLHPFGDSWTEGDAWDLDVESFPRGAYGTPRQSCQYHVRVMAAGVETVGTIPCWRVSLFPGDGAPEAIGGYYYLLVAEKTGWPEGVQLNRRLKPVSAPIVVGTVVGVQDLWVDSAVLAAAPFLQVGYSHLTEMKPWVQRSGAACIVTGIPPGIPIEFFPFLSHESTAADGWVAGWSLKAAKMGREWVVEARFRGPQGEKVLVRQVWHESQGWWTKYERFLDGQLDLTATCVSASSGAVPVDAAPEDVAPRFALRRDARLQTQFPLVVIDPSLTDLLHQLENVTKLQMTIDDGLASHLPAFGSIKLREARPWMVMELIAETQLEGGRWEKTDDGYRLAGKSLVPAPPSGHGRWLVAGVLAFIVSLFFGLLVFLRYRLPPRRLS